MAAMKYFIPIILGTVRAGRRSEHVARYVSEKMTRRPEVETKLIDIRELDLPMDDEGEPLKERNTGYRDDIIRADAIVIVAPEYNHGYPGSLKRALDILYDEYQNKAVGIIGVSAGQAGGARMIEALLPVLRELGLVVSDEDMRVPNVEDIFGDDGMPKDTKALDKRLVPFTERLVWLAATLRQGREQAKTS